MISDFDMSIDTMNAIENVIHENIIWTYYCTINRELEIIRNTNTMQREPLYTAIRMITLKLRKEI